MDRYTQLKTAAGGFFRQLKEEVHGDSRQNMVCIPSQKTNLGGGFKYFLFSSLPGEMIQFDEHIFQMGWFNHQLATKIAPDGKFFGVFFKKDLPQWPFEIRSFLTQGCVKTRC